MSRQCLLSESYSSGAVERCYENKKSGDEAFCSFEEHKQTTTLFQLLRSVFLPEGYPHSVSDDYLEYQVWDTIQAFSSSITGSLATHSLLKGVGVGDESATVMAATLTWIMQRGAGMVGQIVFAWIQGKYFDSECKRWRLFADILNDFSLFLDIVAPYFPSVFRITICLSGVCKSLVGVAGGATRAALTQHQAQRNNICDVAAKDGSQETLVNLAALVTSLILLPLVADSHYIIWLLYIVFTTLHITANYRAVRCVVMSTFNQTRLHHVVTHYHVTPRNEVMNLLAANQLEPVLLPFKRRYTVRLGCSMKHVLDAIEDVDLVHSLYSDLNYMLAVDYTTDTMHIALSESCSTYDQIMAMYHAELIELTATRPEILPLKFRPLCTAVSKGSHHEVLELSTDLTKETFPDFHAAVTRSQWTTSYALLCADEWRGEWGKKTL